MSPFETLSGYLKKELMLKLSATDSEVKFSVTTDECSLKVIANATPQEGGEVAVSLAKILEFLKKVRKNVTLSIRVLNERVVIVDEDLNQFDITSEEALAAQPFSEEVLEVAVIETLPLEKGVIEVGRSVVKSNDVYPILQYAKWNFDDNQLSLVSFDEDTLSIKRINVSKHSLNLLFYLNKFKMELVAKILATVTDTYANVLYGKQSGYIYLKTSIVELSFSVDYFKEVNLEAISNLDGRFLATNLDAVMSDLKLSIPRRPLTEEEHQKHLETLNKAKQGTARWNEAALMIKLGAPMYSISEAMLKPYYCAESQRLRFVVSGSKQEKTTQSFLASVLIQTLKDCENHTAQMKVPTNLNEPLVFVYQDDSSTFERYFMLSLIHI